MGEQGYGVRQNWDQMPPSCILTGEHVDNGVTPLSISAVHPRDSSHFDAFPSKMQTPVLQQTYH